MRRWTAIVTLVGIVGCGDDITPPPPPMENVAEVQLAVGGWHSCVLDRQGQAWCWGYNDGGQLGIGEAGEPVPLPTPVQQSDLRFTSLAAGSSATCALEESGRVYCWGSNLGGVLGIGVDRVGPYVTPVPVAGELQFESLSLGFDSACGLSTDRAIYCWGRNDPWGNLGQSTAFSRILSPTEVAGTRSLELIEVSVGHALSCALAAGGSLYCWGSQSYFGNGLVSGQSNEPTLAAGGRFFDQAEAGAFSACGVSAGVGYCWGENFGGGSLGVGDIENDLSPAPLAGGRSYRLVSKEPENSYLRGGCGITTEGALTCWGSNGDLELGVPTTEETCEFDETVEPCSTVPVPVPLDEEVVDVGLGQRHSCALTKSDEVYCWGLNDLGQLGRGTVAEDGFLPAPVTGLSLN